MRLRNITGSREVIANSPFVLHDPEQYKGHFAEAVFGNDHEIHLEIGMGKGRFLMELARKNPGINYIGIEKYSSVLLRAIQKMEQLQTRFRICSLSGWMRKTSRMSFPKMRSQRSI